MKRDNNIFFVFILLVYLASTFSGIYNPREKGLSSLRNNPGEIEILEAQCSSLDTGELDFCVLFFVEFASLQRSFCLENCSSGLSNKGYDQIDFILFESDNSPPFLI
jgi:hypothetical protein